MSRDQGVSYQFTRRGRKTCFEVGIWLFVDWYTSLTMCNSYQGNVLLFGYLIEVLGGSRQRSEDSISGKLPKTHSRLAQQHLDSFQLVIHP